METKTDIITPIKLIDAASKYNVEYKTLLGLGKSGLIIITKRADEIIADENSIKAYYTLQEQLKRHEEYLGKILEEKREEVNYTIAAYDDFLFSMRTLEKTIKIFPIIINELSLLIKDERTRDIFKKIALGKEIYSVARNHSLSFDRTCSIYAHAIDLVIRRGGLFEKYKNKVIELAKKNHVLDIEINNLKDHIKRLEEIKGISIEIQSLKNIPDNDLYLLSLSLQEDLEIDQRCGKSLSDAGLFTVEDLLRYIVNHNGDINSLLKIKHFGSIYLERLRKTLYNKRIIDENGYSYLFDYLM